MLCVYTQAYANPSFPPSFLGAGPCNHVAFPATSTFRLFAAPAGDDDAEEEDDENDDDDSSSSSSSSSVASSSSAASSSTFKGKHRRALRSLAGMLYLLVPFLPAKVYASTLFLYLHLHPRVTRIKP